METRFTTALRNEENITVTENGARAYKSTLNANLDLFASIGGLRSEAIINGKDYSSKIYLLFEDAYHENPEMAIKIVFYARDVREGLGERKIFRNLIKYIAIKYPDALRNNIEHIGFFGRFDDLYELVDTPLETDMFKYIKATLIDDMVKKNNGLPISNLAKWLKSTNTKNKETKKLGQLTARKLGFTDEKYRITLSSLRAYAKVVEVSMSHQDWEYIDYSKVPSKAMYKYHNAFIKNGNNRMFEYLNLVDQGKAKINTSTVYPYEVVRDIINDPSRENQMNIVWKNLPNFIKEDQNAMIVADVSGSMCSSYGDSIAPIYVALGLALYFAEKNTGAYHNLWMSFSSNATVNVLKGGTLSQKIKNMRTADWGNNTDVNAMFMKILSIAIESRCSQEDLPKSIIIVSDMQFDALYHIDIVIHENVLHEFEAHGYTLPTVIYWNVNSSISTFQVNSNAKNVLLVSGASTNVFKTIFESIGLTPVDYMNNIILSDRYKCITI